MKSFYYKNISLAYDEKDFIDIKYFYCKEDIFYQDIFINSTQHYSYAINKQKSIISCFYYANKVVHLYTDRSRTGYYSVYPALSQEFLDKTTELSEIDLMIKDIIE
jgi:hypothetical protein